MRLMLSEIFKCQTPCLAGDTYSLWVILLMFITRQRGCCGFMQPLWILTASLQITCMWICRGAAVPLLPTVDDLSAEHTDLHKKGEGEEEGEGEEVLPVRFVLLLSPSALLHRLPAWKWHPANPSSLSSFSSSTLPLAFLHLCGPEGFVSVCSCQMPALCTPSSTHPSSLCACERESERVEEMVPPSSSSRLGGCLLCNGASSPQFECVCVCVCAWMGLPLFSATAGMLLNAVVSPDAQQYCLSLSFSSVYAPFFSACACVWEGEKDSLVSPSTSLPAHDSAYGQRVKHRA